VCAWRAAYHPLEQRYIHFQQVNNLSSLCFIAALPSCWLCLYPAVHNRSRPLACLTLHAGSLKHHLQLCFALHHTKHHRPNSAIMSDSDSSGLSSAPEEEVKKLAPIFQRAKKATRKAAPPPKASPPRPKREPSPPHEETLADNPDIAVSRIPDRREMARSRRACRASNKIPSGC